MPEAGHELVGIGAGGNATCIAELADSCGYRITRFLDDAPDKWGTSIDGIPVTGPISAGLDELAPGAPVALTFGNNQLRWSWHASVRSRGLSIPSLISPLAVISPTAKLEDGVYAHSLAHVWSHVRIATGTILHPHATVSHHCTVGRGSFLATNVNIGGSITIGEGAMFGTSSTVSTGVHSVGAQTYVGAGAVVIRDTEPFGVYVGNPARLIRHLDDIALDDWKAEG
ncbi:NeuD/PglB/VioB family sugar acetyltransferase [Parenemella sanctibonifatiensis]|uniref:PglD N-terminal domain-containing protein n=1 Tax=Parenemella sanctibonifatiensis TaxID=2016505 RepID=A0A255EAN4_9ACTN|nr:NeuD/PglB/VioB family sugar acetyltransferase [Parenemella sanctibonifatiensis]OYN87981.1 hypothetical protein CGZ92_06930 [Parenemella sanctibonifatiensis]